MNKLIKFSQFSVLVGGLVLLAACEKRATPSQVTVRFPSVTARAVVLSQSISTLADSATAGFNQDTLTDSTTAPCYAIVVDRPMPTPRFRCDNSTATSSLNGTMVIGLGIAGSTKTVDVPSGASGRLHLLGFTSRDGTCRDFSNPEFSYGNHSSPYLLGSADVVFTPGNVNVELTIQRTLTSESRLTSCDGSVLKGPKPVAPKGDLALGQADLVSNINQKLGLYAPNAVLRMPDGHYLIADCTNRRVLIWNSPPASSSTPPDTVLGQKNAQTVDLNSSASSRALMCPSGLASDGIKLAVSDSLTNRVLIWNSIPMSNYAPADLVLGQPSFTSSTSNNGGLSASSLATPTGIAFGPGGVFAVADSGNDRVLIWNSPPASNNQPADVVVGQANMTGAATGCAAATMNAPDDVLFNGTDLLVADTGNKRVSRFAPVPVANGVSVTNVIGETGTASCAGGVTVTTLNGPRGIAVESGRLFVSDTLSNRVMIWNTVPTGNGVSANYVLGQATFTSAAAATTQAGLTGPLRISAYGNDLWVADTNNNRTVKFDVTAPTNGQNANDLWGHQTFIIKGANLPMGITSSALLTPFSVSAKASRLAVADYGNARVLLWNSAPTTMSQPADLVLGQAAFSTNTQAASATGMKTPTSVQDDGTRIIVTDQVNNRVLIWNAWPGASGASADVVVGQSIFTASGSGVTAATLNSPQDAFSDGTRLIVADSSNHRVLIWNAIPTSNAQPADIVLGQTTLGAGTANAGASTAQGSLSLPTRVMVYDGKLIVLDRANFRILIWNSMPTTNGQNADVVLGQSTFTGSTVNGGALGPHGITTSVGLTVDPKGRLIVSDSMNHRLLIWRQIPTQNFVPADLVIGQPSFTVTGITDIGPSDSTVLWPNGLSSDGTSLWLADQRFNRVLRFPFP